MAHSIRQFLSQWPDYVTILIISLQFFGTKWDPSNIFSFTEYASPLSLKTCNTPEFTSSFCLGRLLLKYIDPRALYWYQHLHGRKLQVYWPLFLYHHKDFFLKDQFYYKLMTAHKIQLQNAPHMWNEKWKWWVSNGSWKDFSLSLNELPVTKSTKQHRLPIFNDNGHNLQWKIGELCNFTNYAYFII